MSQSEVITPQTVDLSNCDREAIHLPGAIQPHGLLFALTEPELEIIQVSNNTFDIIGIHPHNLLKRPLKELLDEQQINSIRECLSEDLEKVNPLTISIKRQKQTLIFDGIVHRSDQVLILELEPAVYQNKADFFSFHHLVQSPLNKMQKASSLHELCQVIVKEVRSLTGFDRVMLYQFDNEGSGTVVAEDKLEVLTPFLDLHYPASDIPLQARKLYILNRLRLIPDFKYQPAELIPQNNPITNSPLDLSFSVLRSVSPLHIEYLTNMDVTAVHFVSQG